MIPATAARRLLVQQRWSPWHWHIRHMSSQNTPATNDSFKLPANIFVFSVLLMPCIGFALYAERYGPSNEKLEDTIRERYGQDVAVAHQKNQAMREFYQKAIKEADSGAEDDRLRQVLYGGIRIKKRLHPIDKELYGTEAGVEAKHRVEEELRAAAEERKQRRKRRRIMEEQVVAVVAVDAAESADATKDIEQRTTNKVEQVGAKSQSGDLGLHATQIVTIAVVGTIAAVAGFLAGGRRN